MEGGVCDWRKAGGTPADYFRCPINAKLRVLIQKLGLAANAVRSLQQSPQRKRGSGALTCKVPYAQVDALQQLPTHLNGHCAVAEGDGCRPTLLQRVDQAGLSNLWQQSARREMFLRGMHHLRPNHHHAAAAGLE